MVAVIAFGSLSYLCAAVAVAATAAAQTTTSTLLVAVVAILSLFLLLFAAAVAAVTATANSRLPNKKVSHNERLFFILIKTILTFCRIVGAFLCYVYVMRVTFNQRSICDFYKLSFLS